MSHRKIFFASLLGLMVFSASVVLFANAQNARSEQTRLASLTIKHARNAADSVRGETVARAGGCIACHTDIENGGAMLAGGVRFASPFGTFVSPNISSDPDAGIGGWSAEMLAGALLNGRSPDGGHYWPVFPNPAFAAMTGQDIFDLHAWLTSSVPIPDSPPEHDLFIPDIARIGLGVWKALYVPDHYRPGIFAERGEYLVEGPAHCAACHAQRDMAGGVSDRRLTGNTRGPEGAEVPAITAKALAGWTEEDLTFFLKIGMTPEGDFSDGHMAAVTEHGTAHLPMSDLKAIAAYLKSLSNEGHR